MPQRDRCTDDDALPVIVPRNDKVLRPTSPARVGQLRKHLVRALRMMDDSHATSPLRPGPDGFAARVAYTACSLCRGWCCRNGEDDGFLDERTLERVRQEGLAPDALAVLRLYLERVPAVGYEGSCIFHGEQGCTLDRSLRSDVCNSYFRGGLYAYLAGGDPTTPVVVIAGEGSRMRTSPVLTP